MVQELTKLAESEPERYAKIWENFGAVLKEGLYEDPERRDALFKLARFATTTHPGRRPHARRLRRRLTREPDGDLLPDRRGRQAARRQPAARGLPRPRRRGAAARRSGRRLLGVERGRLRRQAVQVGQPRGRRHQDDRAERRRVAAPPRRRREVATLIAFFKQTLESEIAEARASDRLTDSLACLVAPEFAPDRQLEKILAAHGRLGERAKAVLEVNASHPLVAGAGADVRGRAGQGAGRGRRLADLRRGAAGRRRRLERRPRLCGAAAPGDGEGVRLSAVRSQGEPHHCEGRIDAG